MLARVAYGVATSDGRYILNWHDHLLYLLSQLFSSPQIREKLVQNQTYNIKCLYIDTNRKNFIKLGNMNNNEHLTKAN